MPDGTLMQWKNDFIDVTSGTKDRKQVVFVVPFISTPEVFLSIIDNNNGTNAGVLVDWETNRTSFYALNRAQTVPSYHIKFRWLAIGRWK